ncbi:MULTISPECIES: hypothetical protein [unclassified Shewanella]
MQFAPEAIVLLRQPEEIEIEKSGIYYGLCHKYDESYKKLHL